MNVKPYADGVTLFATTWDAKNTTPRLANGTLVGAMATDGSWASIEFEAGTVTTYGMGCWSFTAPLGDNPKQVRGKVTWSDGSTWPVVGTYRDGVVEVAVDGHGVSGCTPFVWRAGDRLEIKIGEVPAAARR